MVELNFSNLKNKNIKDLVIQFGLVIVRNAKFDSPDALTNQFKHLVLRKSKTFNINETVQELSPTGYLGSEEWDWHNDRCYLDSDCIGTILYNKKNGHHSPTWFMDMSTLPLEFYENYKNSISTFGHNSVIDTHINQAEVPTLQSKTISKPTVYRHPITNKQVIYASPFNNLTIDTEPIKKYADIHCYKHSWKPDDLLIWDNTTMMHKRFAYLGDRVMWRMQFKIS